jgi:hypothetical protein
MTELQFNRFIIHSWWIQSVMSSLWDWKWNWQICTWGIKSIVTFKRWTKPRWFGRHHERYKKLRFSDSMSFGNHLAVAKRRQFDQFAYLTIQSDTSRINPVAVNEISRGKTKDSQGSVCISCSACSVSRDKPWRSHSNQIQFQSLSATLK